MKFIAENEKLAAALALVKGCIPNRATIPILTHIAVAAKPDNTVSLRASDFDREMEISVPAQVDTAGAAALPGEMLSALVKRLAKGGQCSVAMAGDRCKIASGSSKYNLATLPAGEFPEPKEMQVQPVTFALERSGLRTLLRTVGYAAEPSNQRKFCQGPNLYVRAKQLIATGTDGKRLATVAIDIPKGAASMPDIVIPMTSVATILEMLNGADGEVELAVSPSLLEIKVVGTRFASQLIDGKPFDYEKLIPKPNPLMIFRPYALAEAVNRVGVVHLGTEGNTKLMPQILLSITSEGLKLSAGRGEAQATDAADTESITGSAEIVLWIKYLSECLAMWPETASVGLTQDGPGKAVLFFDPATPNVRHVVMPQAAK